MVSDRFSLYDGSRVLADTRADYVSGGVTGLISERAGGVSKFYHGDQLGSTRGITSSTQSVTDTREYDSFGLLVATTGTTATPFGFVGGHGYRSDSQSGLQLLGARYYDPGIGRFISRDPIGYAGGLNLYAYCGNDPVNGTDPSGLYQIELRFDEVFAGRYHTDVFIIYRNKGWLFRAIEGRGSLKGTVEYSSNGRLYTNLDRAKDVFPYKLVIVHENGEDPTQILAKFRSIATKIHRLRLRYRFDAAW